MASFSRIMLMRLIPSHPVLNWMTGNHLNRAWSHYIGTSSSHFLAEAFSITHSGSSSSHLRCFFRRSRGFHVRFPWVLRAFSLSASTRDSVSDQSQQPHVVQRSNYTGVCLEETIEVGSKKSRLDSWISSRISGVSRARVQSTIRSGLVTVNGRIVDKVSHVVRVGDNVICTIMELRPLRGDPEDIPLDIVYEDAHVLVVNKPADMARKNIIKLWTDVLQRRLACFLNAR